MRASAVSSAVSPLLRHDEEIFQVETRLGEECRVREEVEREADWSTIFSADDRLEVRPPAETMPANPFNRRLDLMRQTFVLGESPDQAENDHGVLRSTGSNREQGTPPCCSSRLGATGARSGSPIRHAGRAPGRTVAQ
jgi:hypothetical protein